MRIAMIGTGYVGLVSGACFSEFGYTVTCVDNDAAKVASLNEGKMPIFEPGLEDLVANNVRAGRLSFTTDLAGPVSEADAVFIAVGTPTARHGEGYADLTYVFAAAEEIAKSLKDYTVVVTKSTVPVGTGRKVQRVIAASAQKGIEFDVASNPEFLREGAAINDFMRPDRVVVGAESERARNFLRELYRPLYLNETPVLVTSLETAELTKYAANAFLATKITFINEIADLCEMTGADVQEVARGIGLDGRIGKKFLHAGPGYGGSCFPKDTLALVHQAKQAGAPLRIVEAVVEVNENRKHRMAGRIINACQGNVSGRNIAVLGLTFKPNTDDMRDAPSLAIIPNLQGAGAKVRAYDPEGMPEARKLLNDVMFCDSAYDTMVDADCLVILTEWNEFRSLDLDRVRGLMRNAVMVDLRNIYRPEEVAAAGFNYTSIGRQGAQPPKGARAVTAGGR